jgi:Putative Flp pilus-assembly TadE/G-like
MERQRGQTLPIWTFGLLTALMLMVMVFDYSNSVRWQIRAQNAADAVAQSIISVQTQHYNKMLMNLHATAVEEWRLRKTMTALLTVLQGNGGCTNTTAHGGLSCDFVYNSLRANYIADVNRYSQDVQNMAAITQYTYAAQQADMNQIAQAYTNANCSGNGATTQADCAFTYTVATPVPRCSVQGALSGVVNTSYGDEVGAGQTLPGGYACATSDLSPLEIEVDTCAKIQPLVAAFFRLTGVQFYAIGRAAATSAMVEQEWINPGRVSNPNTGTVFQANEFPEDSAGAAPGGTHGIASGSAGSSFCSSSSAGYDWYAVHFECGDAWVQNTSGGPGHPGGYQATISSDEFSMDTGFWSALPVSPYSGPFTPSVGNCKTESWSS